MMLHHPSTQQPSQFEHNNRHSAFSAPGPEEPHNHHHHQHQHGDVGVAEPRSTTVVDSQLSPPTASQRGGKAVTPATVIAWLREHYKLGKHGYSKKAAVFAHYQALCAERGAEVAISSTFFGKLVKRAFPEIKTIRKGPRGKVEQCYDRLKPIDPAKASRARWLERMNLYLAALQSPPTAQRPPAAGSSPHSSPGRSHRHQETHAEAAASYASSLDGGHFLSSLLPTFDSPTTSLPSSSSSSSSSPAPSSPAVFESVASLPTATPQHVYPLHHHHHHHGQQEASQSFWYQASRGLNEGHSHVPAQTNCGRDLFRQASSVPTGSSRSTYLSLALSPADHFRHDTPAPHAAFGQTSYREDPSFEHHQQHTHPYSHYFSTLPLY